MSSEDVTQSSDSITRQVGEVEAQELDEQWAADQRNILDLVSKLARKYTQLESKISVQYQRGTDIQSKLQDIARNITQLRNFISENITPFAVFNPDLQNTHIKNNHLMRVSLTKQKQWIKIEKKIVLLRKNEKKLQRSLQDVNKPIKDLTDEKNQVAVELNAQQANLANTT